MKGRNPMSLASHITAIGHQLVACPHHCQGVLFDPPNGILPRFLVLEDQDRHGNRGSVIVGINPGRSKASEREVYRNRGPTYPSTVAYWRKKIWDHRYYHSLRSLVSQLEFSGPILWTELAKCERAPELSGLLPLQTFRTCVGSYLQRELEPIPDTWPLIAVGTEPFKALAYRFPHRAIIGVPHPTGSYGHFHSLFDDERLRLGVKASVSDLWQGDIKKAVWLSAPTQ